MAKLHGEAKRRFLAKMQAGRNRKAARERQRAIAGLGPEPSQRQRRGENPGRARIHTKKYDRTVRAVKKSLKRYHRKGNAYAIASARLGEKRSILKSHRRKTNARGQYLVGAVRKHGPGPRMYLSHDNLMSSSEAAAARFHTREAARRMAQRVATALGSRYRVGVYA